MSKADAVLVALCVYAGGYLSAVGWFVLSVCGSECEGGRGGREGRGHFFGCLTFWGFSISRLARLNCRRFLAGAVLLERDVCCWAFMSRVPCTSMGLSSKIVCSIDGKVA